MEVKHSNPYAHILYQKYIQTFVKTIGGIFNAINEDDTNEIDVDDWHAKMFDQLFIWWMNKGIIPPNLTQHKSCKLGKYGISFISKHLEQFRYSIFSSYSFRQIIHIFVM